MSCCNTDGFLPGHSLQPLEDGTGGWLAHRTAVDAPGSGPGQDWVKEAVLDPDSAVGTSLASAKDFTVAGAKLTHKPRILVLYGSLREKSFSHLLAEECARILELLGADVRVFNPKSLPIYDPADKMHPKAREMLSLTLWAEGHVWVSPEMHGQMTAVFKNQIDWIPLSFGAVRPTQGKTVCVMQVSGGSQSFNVVNELRRLARWMRMPCCTNQATVPQAWNKFDEDGRMKPGSERDRVIDVLEEYYQFTLIMREQVGNLNSRYSERKDMVQKGQLTAGQGAATKPAEPPKVEGEDLKCCPSPPKDVEPTYVDENAPGDDE